jgi:phosphoribosylamine--glycine ligase
LVDEIHTPDSSRFWKCGDEKEKNPKQISKEFLREELIQILGHPENFTQNPIYHPELQKKAVRENLASRVSQRYQELFELITGKINPDDIYKEIKFISWPIEKTLFSKAIENQTLPEKILVVGNGGRDFVLSNEFANLSEVNTIYCMAGNRNWSHPKFEMFPMSVPEKISFFAYEMRVGLVIAGPEAPIAKGLEEYCTAQGVPVLSPSLACASLESSKILCKQLVESAGIRTPLSHVLPWSELKPFMEENKLKIPCVLKYDSLASGKGVFVIKNKQDITNALQSIEDNLPTWDKLSQEILTHTYSKIKGEPCFLIEDCIEGEEFSAIALCNGEHYRLLPIAKDYKRRNDNQSGPNTGGMGAMAPVNLSEKLLVQVRNAFDKTLKKLVEKGTPYRGFLFAGFMVDKNQEAHLLEFNCRLGDPETQVVLPSLGREFFAEIYHTAKKQTFLFPEKSGQFFSSDGKKRVFVVGASPEYPEKNAPKRSFILPKWEETKDVKIDFIPSSIEMNNTTTGGRAFGLLGCANSFETARKEIYKIMETIKFENEDGNFVKPHYRTDIGEEK